MVKDELRFYKNIFGVPIPQKLIASARVAHKSHNQYLKQQRLLKEKKQKDEEEQKEIEKEITEKKKSLKKCWKEAENSEIFLNALKEEKIKNDAGLSLLGEAKKKKITIAVEKQDLTQVGIVIAMLDSVQRVQQEANKKEKEMG